MSGWQQLFLGLLSYAWMLIPVPVIASTPRRFFLPVVATSVIFYGGLVGVGHFANDAICYPPGSGCPTAFLIVPMFLLGAVLSVIALIIRLVTKPFER